MPDASLQAAPPTRVLFVCLGNICRSPAAEGLFLQRLELRGLSDAFVVDSAGTGSWHVGKRADARMIRAAEARGVVLPSRARQITAADLQTFDLILTMDPSNLENVRKLVPAEAISARIEPMTAYCRRYRTDAVPDPYYGGADGFNDVLDLLEDACDGLLDALLERRGNG